MSDAIVPIPIPSGQEREQQIYAGALFGTTTAIPAAISMLEQKAKETLAPPAFDYLAGGAGGEDTMRANREAFYRWRIVPRMLRDVSRRDLSVELVGVRLPAPVILGPVGVQGIIHNEAEVASARAAASLVAGVSLLCEGDSEFDFELVLHFDSAARNGNGCDAKGRLLKRSRTTIEAILQRNIDRYRMALTV